MSHLLSAISMNSASAHLNQSTASIPWKRFFPCTDGDNATWEYHCDSARVFASRIVICSRVREQSPRKSRGCRTGRR
jgi:hypothetical protein